ncbi:MAG TPA: Asp-tRNA(Asn)/Glu-tRNA(Gln) amidotransferase subunit GatB [Candidatus Eisenbacteria bacterium]|nr:Asp-tRNA(Asn)/Glu-tRNA(Gln) amidotransferase subunit GatB [Candidatus Eisenbacteria bacterium]
MSVLTTIGLEVHVQLGSKTKIFCGCEVKFGSKPNGQVCPVCLGLPGVLPVLNREVFRLGLRAVLALGGEPSTLIQFDRKNYFYPDLPKGYQISQYDHPLGRGGQIEIETPAGAKKIRLNRLHLEEDAGKLLHDQSPEWSLVDLNRAGTPLAEIVSEPDLESSDEAYAYLTALKAVLRAIGVSECDMEKGQLRCDANVSVRKAKADPLGKRVEIKNLNSFKAVKAAIDHEVERQSAALEKGETITQETRLWDDEREKTFAMRSKEEAHDYRYFPEPDLVPFSIDPSEIERERAALPELPKAKKERFIAKYGLSAYDSGLLTQETRISEFFEETNRLIGNPKTTANWITGPVFAYLGARNLSIEETRLTPALLAGTAGLVQKGSVSLQAAREKILPDVLEQGLDPASVMKEKGLEQVSDDSALEGWIAEAIAGNPKVVAEFKGGKDGAVMFLVGQVMKKSGGKANPGKVQEMMRKTLAGS